MFFECNIFLRENVVEGYKIKSDICKEKKMWAGKKAEIDAPFHRDDAILEIHFKK